MKSLGVCAVITGNILRRSSVSRGTIGLGSNLIVSLPPATRMILAAKTRSRRRRGLVLAALILLGLSAVNLQAATINWTGGGDGYLWSDAANWDTGTVPGISDDVFIETGGGDTVTLTATVTVNSLYSEKDMECQAASLTVKAPSTINGALRINSGYSLTATGSSATLQVNGMAYISGANLYATSGGGLILPVTEEFYTTPTDGSRMIRAIGTDSRINLPGIAVLVGPSTSVLDVHAFGGGVIDLSALEEAKGNIRFEASGPNSLIQMPLLVKLDKVTAYGINTCSVTVRDSGVILIPSLQVVNSWSFYAYDGLTLDLSNVTSYTFIFDQYGIIQASGPGSTIDLSGLTLLTGPSWRTCLDVKALDGGTIDFSSLEEARINILFEANGQNSTILMPVLETLDSSASGEMYYGTITIRDKGSIALPSLTTLHSWSFYAYDGLTLDLSSVTSYTFRDSQYGIIQASGPGSTIDLSGLTQLTGPSWRTGLDVKAIDGGMIDFSSLEEGRLILLFLAEGKDSVIHMPSLEKLDTYSYIAGQSLVGAVTVKDKGVVSFPNLKTVNSWNFYAYDGLVLDLSSVTTCSSLELPSGVIQASGAGSLIDLSGLPLLSGPTWRAKLDVIATSGGVIDFSSLEEARFFVHFKAEGQNSTVHMPSLEVLDTNIFRAGQEQHGTLTIRDKGTIPLPNLHTAKTWSFYAYDGLILDISSMMTYLNNVTDYPTAIHAYDGSIIDLSGLTLLIGSSILGRPVTIQAFSGGSIQIPALESMTGDINVGAQGVNSQIVLSNLKNMYGLSTTWLKASEGGTVLLDAAPFTVHNVSVELSAAGMTPGFIEAPTLYLDSASRISGVGTIRGDLVSAGPIRPGGSGGFGTLTIEGACTIEESGSLEIDLAGLVPDIQYDQFYVTDTLYPNGRLDIVLRSAFVPSVNDKFDVLFYDAHVGTFPSVTGVDLGGGRELRTVYRPNRLVLGERAGLISPAIPVLTTPRNVALTHDLKPHNKFADQPIWSIDPASTELYTATIDANEVLTITPVTNEHGVAAPLPTLTLTDLADGFSDVQELDLTVALILPTAPIPFVFPTGDLLETDDLVCGLLPGTVGPGCPIFYRYIWENSDSPFRPPGYPPFEPKTVVHGPDVFVVDILNASETSPYETWTCTVHTFDGQYYSDTAGIATSGEIQPLTTTSLNFTLLPQTITLGQPVSLSGNIDPVVGVVPLVFNTATPPGGTNTQPTSINTNTDSSFSMTFLPDEAGSWGFTATWLGNTTHWGANAFSALTVSSAHPNLLISQSHTSALLNLAEAEDFTVTVSLSVPGFPVELMSLLGGRTVRLSVQTPDGQTPWTPLEAVADGNGTVQFDKAAFDDAGIVFNQSGVWRFRAQFGGNENLRAASTPDFATTTARLTIKEGSGYAIIVLGRLDAAAEGHAEHAQTSDYIYSMLKGRNFADEDIYYLREHLAGEEDRGHPVSGAATAANLQYAIETWAQAKMLASPAPLYLILVNHGNPGIFYMDVGATGPVEFVTAGDIGDWLNLLQSGLGGKASAAEQPIMIIYGACYSGSFIPALSGPNRIIITSSSGSQISYRGVKNGVSNLRDGDFFLTEFFRNAGEGRTVKDAFEQACHKTYEYTASRTGAGAHIPQHPRLDDNGDGDGATGLLSSVAGLDGAIVAGMDLGLGSNAGNTIGWFTASSPMLLAPGEPLPAELWAEATGRELVAEDSSWIEVKTPAYSDGEVATAGYDLFQRVASMVGPIVPGTAPESLGDGSTRHIWSYADLTAHPDLASGFITPGTYKVYYFLRDGVTGQVGAYLVTNIYVSQPGNQPPSAVTQLYPDDDGIVNANLFLAWTESIDPDGDPVTYRVEISEDPAFPVGTTIVKDGLTDTVLTLDVGDGIVNDHDYYWRVIPTDPYGASPSSNDVRRFLVRGSPGVPGAITGSVKDMDSSTGISGCTLTLSPTALAGTSTATGAYFLGNVSQGVYNLTLSAPGYTTQQVTGVIVTSGRYTVLNVGLEPDGNRPPTMTLIGNKQVTHGHTLAFTVTATDPDAGQTLTYGVTGLPSGATFDTATGQFSWQPVQAHVAGSPYTVTFSVSDNGVPVLMDQETILITVNLGAYITGPSHATVGDWVELEFHGEDIPDAWETHWQHEGHDIIGETESLLVLGEVTLDDEGLYEATQVFTKEDPITASFYLTVSEGMPLHKGALLALIAVLATLAFVYAGRRDKKQEGMGK